MENSSVEKLTPTLLSVMAHPDDETFGMGGTLALYARRAVDVHLVCATGGEVGIVDPQYLEGYASIAERRHYELRCAAEILGIKSIHFLGYRDSGMPGSPDNQHPQSLAAAPQEKVVAEIVHIIRLLRPQVVVTFDPLGGYLHPDHIAIHQATVIAFDQAGQADYKAGDLQPFSPQKLYFQLIPRAFLRPMVKIMRFLGRDPRKFGKNKDIDLAAVAEVDFPIHALINYRSVSAVRDKASACHASQGGGQMTGGGMFILRLRRWFLSNESYMQAYPIPVPGHFIKDLFDGVEFE
jgi:N-acetyl-1-D-myo-inositol-2-amino-2-deoxy-alpha-D-glucopyranoside deacetylase